VLGESLSQPMVLAPPSVTTQFAPVGRFPPHLRLGFSTIVGLPCGHFHRLGDSKADQSRNCASVRNQWR
jgi:hypothetical protein